MPRLKLREKALQSWHVVLLALSACAPPTPSLPPSPAGGGRDKRAGLGQEDGANLEVLSFAPKQALLLVHPRPRSALQFPHVTLKIETHCSPDLDPVPPLNCPQNHRADKCRPLHGLEREEGVDPKGHRHQRAGAALAGL